MTVDVNKPSFNGDFFNLNEDSIPADEKQFIHGLTMLADQALEVLSHPQEIELAFQCIEKVKLIELNAMYSNSLIHKRIQEVFEKWVKVILGDQCRHIPKERLVMECGDKFKSQFTSKMTDAREKTVNLLLPEGITSQELPQSLCEAFLVFLQTGEISDNVLEEDVMTLLSLADQHRVEGLVAKCIVIIEEHLDYENLPIVLDFIKNRHFPRLKMASLLFMHAHANRIPSELKNTYQKELCLVNEISKNSMEQRLSPTGNIEVQINSLSKYTSDLLMNINNLYPIQSLIIADKYKGSQVSFLKKMAPSLKGLLELIVTDASIQENALKKLKKLFPKLNSFGNDAPFLKSFDEVIAYFENFRNTGLNEQDFEKPLLRSLNLEAVSHLTDKQFDVLISYYQQIDHLFIKSDAVTKIVSPKAKCIFCSDSRCLTTIEAHQAKKIVCYDCTSLITLITPHAEEIDCPECTSLTTIEANRATLINFSYCKNLTTLIAPQAKKIEIVGCRSLTTLRAHQALVIDCRFCTNLTTLEAHQAKKISYEGCANLTNLIAPQSKVFLNENLSK